MAKQQLIELSVPQGTLISKMRTELQTPDVALIVPPSCEAVFVENGKALGVFGEGKEELKDDRGFFAKLFKRDRTVPVVHIYCVNKSVPVQGYWGTPTRVQFRERETGIPVSAGLCGTYRLRVSNTLKLLKNLLGLNAELTVDAVTDYFASEVASIVRDKFFALVTGENISFLELAGNLTELARAIRTGVDEVLGEYGLETVAFTVDSVSLDDDVRNLVREYALDAYRKKMDSEESEREKAEKERLRDEQRERELWERKMQEERERRRDEIELARVQAEARKKEEKEEKPMPLGTRFCSGCGAAIVGNVKFCPECGTPLKRICSCGAEMQPGAKFCPECGKKAE